MADSSKDIPLRELKDMVAELKNLINTLQETVDAERYKGIPVTKEYLNLEDTKCPVCGADLVSIGEEFVRRELVFIPAQLRVVEYYSISYSCPECKRKDFPTIKKGKDGKAHMLYGMASAGTVAWVMYQKFCNSLPYYRQEKDWEQYGASIT